MNSRLIKTLSLICIILIVIIIAESSYAKRANIKLNKELGQVTAGNIEIERLASINLTEKSIESYPNLVKKPLFNQTRRPIKKVAKAIVKPITKTIKFKHELIGIFGKANKMRALFRNKTPKNKKNNHKDDKFFTVYLGKNIKGSIIKEINSNTVIIDTNGKIETIKWSKTKPKIFKTLQERVKKKVLTKKKARSKKKKLTKNNAPNKSLTPPPPRQ